MERKELTGDSKPAAPELDENERGGRHLFRPLTAARMLPDHIKTARSSRPRGDCLALGLERADRHVASVNGGGNLPTVILARDSKDFPVGITDADQAILRINCAVSSAQIFNPVVSAVTIDVIDQVRPIVVDHRERDPVREMSCPMDYATFVSVSVEPVQCRTACVEPVPVVAAASGIAGHVDEKFWPAGQPEKLASGLVVRNKETPASRCQVAASERADETRSIGELVASIVSEMGAGRAMLPGGYCDFGERVSGRKRAPRSEVRPSRDTVHDADPRNSASLCEQSARPHLAQRGM